MNIKKISDEDLVFFVQESGGNGFEEIIDRYQLKIFHYINRMIRDEDLADDIAQNTFISAYENINSFDTTRKFSSWIYRIAHNKTVNEIRSRKKVLSLEDAPEISSSDDVEKLEKKLDGKRAREILEENLGRVSIKYQEPLILRYFEDKTYEEISDILKIPTSTVGIRLKRGLEKLKSNIKLNLEDYL
ncbi:sigma-70 family RNA polymerase sigma factor [Patescibacteria group bacterium]|nr:sigma-70 family RNA polymerase sigma factor [Patescibacteria group bacterium]